MKTVPHKPATPKTFKLATRWAIIINGDLFDMLDNEKEARQGASVMYSSKQLYANAVRKKEIAVLKVNIRPAQPAKK